MANRTGEHYDTTTIGLHWVTALMVVPLSGGAELDEFVPAGVGAPMAGPCMWRSASRSRRC